MARTTTEPTVGFRIPVSVHTALRELADRERHTITEVLRRAVLTYAAVAEARKFPVNRPALEELGTEVQARIDQLLEAQRLEKAYQQEVRVSGETKTAALLRIKAEESRTS